jgi:hypothetical protein
VPTHTLLKGLKHHAFTALILLALLGLCGLAAFI